MKLVLAIIAATVFTYDYSLFANAWVKNEGSYYTKLSMDETTVKNFLLQNLDINEVEESVQFYGEWGLGLSNPTQFSLYTSRKTFIREERSGDLDRYEAASLTDTKLIWKTRLFDISKYIESPIGFLVSASTGLVLATTPDEFALGNEAMRVDEVPNGKGYLLAVVDKGSNAPLVGIQTTFLYGTMWLNAEFEHAKDYHGAFVDQKTAFSLGFGLPMNSWIQINHSIISSQIEASALAGNALNNLDDKTQQTGASVGFTVWQGLAIEASYNYNTNITDIWSDWETVGLGLSYRSL